MGSTIEVILTIIALSFWILFPIGMFISVSQVDKNTDQIVRLDHQRHGRQESEQTGRPIFRPVRFNWHHPIHFFREWLQHD